MKNLMLVSMMSLASCGSYDEYESWESERTKSDSETEVVEESTTEVTRSNRQTETRSEVEVSVEVRVAKEVINDHWPVLLEYGLTMDQVAAIIGEPDDSFGRAGGGRHWHYNKGRDACMDTSACGLYFNREGLLDLMLDVHASYKNHRTY